MPSLIRKSLRDQRRAIIGWMIGLSVYASIYLSFYGRFNEISEAKMAAMPEQMRVMFGFSDVISGVGYLEGIVFTLFGPLLVITYAALLGNRGVAALEEAGVLDLYLSNPISRRRFLLGRYAVFAGGVTAGVAVLWVFILLFAATKNMGVSVANLSAACLSLLLLALCFGTLAFAVGAVTGRRGTVFAVTGTAAVATYMCKALPEMIDGWYGLRWLSPFHYYLGGDPLRDGLHPGYALVLVALTAASLAAALVRFDARDVGV